MKTIFENEYGVTCVWIRKGEEFPGTRYITNRQGYYVYSPNQGESWTYIGRFVSQLWLYENYGANLLSPDEARR